MIGVNMDITERKQAEEAVAAAQSQVQSIIDNATSIIYAFDLEERFLLVNTALAELLNSTPEQMIGKRRHDFMPKEDADWHEANDRQVIESGRALEFDEHSQLKGRSITWLTTKFPLRDTQGRIYAVAGISADITDLKKIEKDLKQRTAELEAINRELESFSYSISHDLRAPLRAIDGYARMLLKKHGHEFDEDSMRKFNVIRSNSQMMGRLIDDLLALSRLGKKHMSVAMLNMDDIIRDVWSEMQTIHPERNMNLFIRSMPSGYADRTLIKQVYANLLENAVKFTKFKNPAQIEAGGYNEGEENVFYIKDNGTGFDMAYCDKLFGIFQRLHSSPEFEGTGVGLATVQRVINRHSGRVWAEGKVNEGATFYFSLPLSHTHINK
jgi:PAS domain S-box-containing protein